MNQARQDDAHATTGESGVFTAPPVARLRAAVMAAARTLAETSGSAPDGSAITLERPRRAQFGDYATNAALILAPGLGEAPREVAERLGAELSLALGANLERYEVAGPGFLNLFISDAWLLDAVAEALAVGERFGAGSIARPERIMVEFVSANPTGPMHVGHARNAAFGDALSRILSFAGHEVAREFYVNDAGTQVRKLGESILALAGGEPVPEDGYRGDYVERLVGLAAGDGACDGLDPVAVGRAAVAEMVAEMRRVLEAFNVAPFDTWSYESALHDGSPSEVDRTLALLKEQGHTYERDGALWLATSELGDDKDRVLLRSSGEHTYFASDIAYHQDKRDRGFERQLDVWGADHHGYIPRMKAAYAALGGDPDELELLIMQFVHLVRSGGRAQMSKRSGEFVALEDLVSEIGVDASRWYLLARSHDTTIDLDLDLALAQSNENPVYYVQYAHARIASILARADTERLGSAGEEPGAAALAAGYGLHAAERHLIEQVIAFPEEVAEAAVRRAPHRIAAYVLDLAQGFTAFYTDCRVIGAESAAIESLRLSLCLAARQTIAASLGLLGVAAPQEM